MSGSGRGRGRDRLNLDVLGGSRKLSIIPIFRLFYLNCPILSCIFYFCQKIGQKRPLFGVFRNSDPDPESSGSKFFGVGVGVRGQKKRGYFGVGVGDPGRTLGER
jgi:hypothetical protein